MLRCGANETRTRAVSIDRARPWPETESGGEDDKTVPVQRKMAVAKTQKAAKSRSVIGWYKRQQSRASFGTTKTTTKMMMREQEGEKSGRQRDRIRE